MIDHILDLIFQAINIHLPFHCSTVIFPKKSNCLPVLFIIQHMIVFEKIKLFNLRSLFLFLSGTDQETAALIIKSFLRIFQNILLIYLSQILRTI